MIPQRCRLNGPGPASPIHENSGCRGEPGYAQSKLPRSKVRNALAAKEGVSDFRETQLQRVIFVTDGWFDYAGERGAVTLQTTGLWSSPASGACTGSSRSSFPSHPGHPTVRPQPAAARGPRDHSPPPSALVTAASRGPKPAASAEWCWSPEWLRASGPGSGAAAEAIFLASVAEVNFGKPMLIGRSRRAEAIRSSASRIATMSPARAPSTSFWTVSVAWPASSFSTATVVELRCPRLTDRVAALSFTNVIAQALLAA